MIEIQLFFIMLFKVNPAIAVQTGNSVINTADLLRHIMRLEKNLVTYFTSKVPAISFWLVWRLCSGDIDCLMFL